MSTEKQKVLIVDDEPRNQRIIAETFEDTVEQQYASSGEETLKVLESYQPDLVLLDIMMPDISGYDVCKSIRANPKFKFIKVILVSGKAMLDERLTGYEVGADDYMTKPFVPEELLAKSKVFLRLNKVEKELSVLNQSLEGQVYERTRQLIEAESRLIHSAKMAALGEMAGSIAHEINTPLSTVMMLSNQISELLNEQPPDLVETARMTQVISDTAGRIAGIVRGLKTFSRDGNKDAFAAVPLKQILNDTLALCNEKLKNGNIKLIIENSATDFTIECRPVQISQVLLNLINNAQDAIQQLPEKWININFEKQPDFVQIFITDSGSGISEEIKSKIFQPFFTTKQIGVGTGLGLSISKGIVDAHHGSLDIDKNCTNTRFVLRLPLKQEAPSNKNIVIKKAG